MARTRLQAIGEESIPELIGTTEAIQPPPAPPRDSAWTSLLILSLRALSQRAIVALASLVDLALLASVFVIALLIIRDPTVLQLVLAAGYAMFVTGALLVRRRE